MAVIYVSHSSLGAQFTPTSRTFPNHASDRRHHGGSNEPPDANQASRS